ncbi:hypothetical protein [Sutcliffiella cohnii]|uniref:hypothetical protein n=1 Tax=Sutcliffiella cohnii TaxID=33932 RepID=UPI002E1E211E|nr:hypothetical protein [Sutcliffiella cohnii]
MKSKLAIILSLLFILIGCSSEEEKVINRFKSEEAGKYSIVVFDVNLPSADYQKRINIDLVDANELWEKMHLLSFISLNENTSQDYDYKEVFSLSDLPEIVVFDHKGIVLQTNKFEELEEFFLKMK